MKKKLISTLLIVALVLCAVPVAFPSFSTESFACTGTEPCSDPDPGESGPPGEEGDVKGEAKKHNKEEVKKYNDDFIRFFVWVERTRDEYGEKADYIKAELVPAGTVYYEHEALDSELDFSLRLRIGELKILLPEEYTKQDFSFAARPDGSGGYKIILKDADGNDIEYTVVE